MEGISRVSRASVVLLAVWVIASCKSGATSGDAAADGARADAPPSMIDGARDDRDGGIAPGDGGGDPGEDAGSELDAGGGPCVDAECDDGNLCSDDRCNAEGVCVHLPTGMTDVVCRAAAGDCDLEERCEPESIDCPVDTFGVAGSVCRASAGDCDLPETCDGRTAACPVDAFRATSVMCRAASGVCDVAEHCSGTGATCPTDAHAPSGTPITASSVFDWTALAGGGNTCFLSNALATDSRVAGLDYNASTTTTDGFCVTSCLGVTFSRPISGTIVIQGGPTANACGGMCSGTSCGTGHEMRVFAGARAADPLTNVALVTLTGASDTISRYTVSLGTRSALNVAVCRPCFGAGRDDVMVDSIQGACP